MCGGLADSVIRDAAPILVGSASFEPSKTVDSISITVAVAVSVKSCVILTDYTIIARREFKPGH